MGTGRILIVAGVVLIVLGLAVNWGPRMPFRLGRLPGDFSFQGKNGTFYFPLTTCVLLSVVLSVVMWVVRRMR